MVWLHMVGFLARLKVQKYKSDCIVQELFR